MYKIEFYTPLFSYELRNLIHDYTDEFFIQEIEQLKLFNIGQGEAKYYCVTILLMSFMETQQLREQIKIVLNTSGISTNIYYSRLDNDYNNNYNHYQGSLLDDLKPGGSQWK